MIDQSRIEIKKFVPEDMLRLLGESPEVAANARLNQLSGPAKSIFLDKELLCCGGIRIKGIGEAWSIYSPEALDDIRFVLSKSKKEIDRMGREHSLWRLWAEVTINDEKHKKFMRHMNFTEMPAWCRLL
jgi:hypothetical protein